MGAGHRLGNELQQPTRVALFSLSGFTTELQQVAQQEDIVLVAGEDLLRPT
jgi:hypothetical protein